MCLTPRVWVAVKLYLLKKATSGRLQFTRYVDTPITLRYGTSWWKIFSPSSVGWNWYLSLWMTEQP